MSAPESPPELIPAPELPSRSIFWKMANILASPSEAYDELAGRPAKAVNWLVPVICMCVMGLIYVTIVFSQPSVKQQMRELQTKAYQKMVTSGKLSQAKADEMQDKMEGITNIVTRVGAAVGAVFGPFIWVAFASGFLKLASKLYLKTPIRFDKAAEICGLATVISSLAFVITLFCVVGTGNLFATPSLGIFVKDFDLDQKLHVTLAAVNIFNIWILVAMGIGLSRVLQLPAAKCITAVFGIWIPFKALLILAKMGQFAM